MRVGADTRGQAIQIGAVILFGFAIIAFAGYQAVSVPSQNQEVEFRHSMDIADQMQEFRADVIEAGSTGSTRSQPFKLGTDYPTRLFAVNPVPVSGQLSTTTFGGGEYVLDAPGANLESICGLSREGDDTYDVPSQALVYEPNYNQYTQAPTIVYENTVTYRQFPGQVRLDSGQNLVDGKTLTLTPLVGDVSESTSATRTVDLAPGKAGIGATDSGTVTLTVPTALDAGTWEELLADEPQVDSVTNNVTTGGVDIELLAAEYTVICPVVGFDTTPTNTPNDEIQRSGDGSANLNPGDAGEVRLAGIDPQGQDTVTLTFTNGGDTVNLSSARYNFYFGGTSGGGANPDSLDIQDDTGTTIVQNLQLRGETKEPQNNLTFDGGGANTDVDVVLSEDYKNGDYFVVTLRYTDGQESLYFVDIVDSGGGNGAPTASFTSSNGGSDTIDVDAGGSTDPDSDTLTYEWDWTSDGTYEGSGEMTSHDYGSSDTYEVTLRVRDGNGGTDTVTQDVTVSSGNSPAPGFSPVSASDVAKGDSSTGQTISFSPDQTLPAEETVTIDLSAAQGVNNDKPDPVDYQNADVDEAESTLQGGTASLTASADSASITYTPSRDVGSDEIVTIELTGVSTTNANNVETSVSFSRTDGGSVQATFSVTNTN